MSKISFIVPAYNIAESVRACLESITHQTCGDWELIVVDDGSTDSSGLICDEYANLPNVTIVHKENGGVSTARNAGLDIATGEWIWFIDGDDFIERDALEQLLPQIDGKNLDLGQFSLRESIDGVIQSKKKIDDVEDMLPNDFLMKYPCFNNVTMLFSRDIIEKYKIRFTEGLRLGEDLEFQMKYLCFVEHPAQFSNSLSVYSIRNNSATKSTESRRRIVEDSCIEMGNILDFVEKNRVVQQPWIAFKMANMMRNILYSSSLVKSIDRAWLQTEVRRIMDLWRSCGRPFDTSRRLRLAYWDIRAYWFLNRIYLKVRGLK